MDDNSYFLMASKPPLNAFLLISLYLAGTLSNIVSSRLFDLKGRTSTAEREPSNTMFFVISAPASFAILTASNLYNSPYFSSSLKTMLIFGYFSSPEETV